MSYEKPTIADFKSYFARDFVYGTVNTSVMDADILKAFADCDVSMNAGLFSGEDQFTIGYLNLAAHNLVMNLRASSQGINGQYSWLQASKGVGSVSESFAIPARITDNPQLAALTKTHYGAKYLMMILAAITGPIFVVGGGTRA